MLTQEQKSKVLAEVAKEEYALLSTEGKLAKLREEKHKQYSLRFVNKRTFAGLFGPAVSAAAMGNLKTAAAADSTGTLQLIFELLDTVGNEQGDRGGCDVGNEIGQGQVDSLKDIMQFTAEQAEKIKSMGYRMVSWFVSNDVPELHEGDLNSLLGGE